MNLTTEQIRFIPVAFAISDALDQPGFLPARIGDAICFALDIATRTKILAMIQCGIVDIDDDELENAFWITTPNEANDLPTRVNTDESRFIAQISAIGITDTPNNTEARYNAALDLRQSRHLSSTIPLRIFTEKIAQALTNHLAAEQVTSWVSPAASRLAINTSGYGTTAARTRSTWRHARIMQAQARHDRMKSWRVNPLIAVDLKRHYPHLRPQLSRREIERII